MKYLWIGLRISCSDENWIRQYCKAINYDIGVNLQSFTLPQHISLKTSFLTRDYLKIIDTIKKMFLDYKKTTLTIDNVELVPGVIWLSINETKKLRDMHNDILRCLKDSFAIDPSGYDGDGFKFHSTLFQDIDNKELVSELYKKIDKSKFIKKRLTIDGLCFGISEIGKVGTYNIVDSIDFC